jgi:hypothetical protein
VAKDVRVYDASDKRRTLAVISEMVLQVNFSNLIRGKTFLDALDLHDASLSLPLDPEKPHGRKIEITRLNGRLFLPPQQIYLANLDADVFGLHVSASGRLIHPQAFRLSANSGQALAQVARIVDQINGIKFESEPPVLSLTFSGDLAEPEQIFVELAFWAERIRRERYTLKNLYIGASFRGGLFDLKQLVATDSSGELRLSGWWDPSSQHAELQLRSGIDAASLAHACGNFPWLDDFVFYAPPEISLRLDTTMGEKPAFLATGQVNAGKFAYRSVVFEHAESGFSWDGRRWSLRDVRVKRGDGEELTGDALQGDGDFQARLASTLNPKAFRPLLAEPMAETLRQFEFSQPPQVNLEARGLSSNLDALRIDGEAFLGKSSFRGVSAESAHATLHFENHVLALEPFHIKRSEGDGYGSLYYDFGRDELHFDKVHARVNPPEVAMWIDPNMVSAILPYRFVHQPPNLLIDGVLPANGGPATHLAIQVEAPAGLDYTFLGKNLRLGNLRGNLLFTENQLSVSDLNASLLGGAVSGTADISLAKAHPGHTANMTVTNVDFGSLEKLYFDAAGSHGHVSGRCDFTASGEDRLEGHGELTAVDANVFAIPFLGSLSSMIEKAVPALAGDLTCEANSTFRLTGDAVTTNDLVVRSKEFRMSGSGSISLLADKADFSMRFRPEGLPALFLSPLLQRLEFVTGQQFSKPQWQLKIAPDLQAGH